jgi:hypothetical protein
MVSHEEVLRIAGLFRLRLCLGFDHYRLRQESGAAEEGRCQVGRAQEGSGKPGSVTK